MLQPPTPRKQTLAVGLTPDRSLGAMRSGHEEGQDLAENRSFSSLARSQDANFRNSLHKKKDFKTRVSLWTWQVLLYGRFQVLTATDIKMSIFCDAAPCSLIEIQRYCRGTYCLHHQGDNRPVISANFYRSTRRNIPYDSHLHICRCESLKCHLVNLYGASTHRSDDTGSKQPWNVR